MNKRTLGLKRHDVLCSFLYCVLFCVKKISYCKEHFFRNYCCLFFILSFFFSLSPFSVLKLSTIARAYFFMIFIKVFLSVPPSFANKDSSIF